MGDINLTEIAQRTRMSREYWRQQAMAGKVPGVRKVSDGIRRVFLFDEATFAAWWETQLTPVPYQPASFDGAAALAHLRPRQQRLLAWAKDGDEWIYFVASSERVKIGFTSMVIPRLTQIKTSCPTPVYLVGLIPGTRGDEAELHERFAAARVRGEWFKPTKELVEFITVEACGHG